MTAQDPLPQEFRMLAPGNYSFARADRATQNYAVIVRHVGKNTYHTSRVDNATPANMEAWARILGAKLNRSRRPKWEFTIPKPAQDETSAP